MEKETKVKVAVVGVGLVGAMSACYMAKMGYEVHVYESRKDSRTAEPDTASSRSINLIMSERGLTALEEFGLADRFCKEERETVGVKKVGVVGTGVPVRGRMLHPPGGKKMYPAKYAHSNAAFSINRRHLNEELLTAAEKFDNVHLHFEHRLREINVDKAEMTFLTKEGEFFTSADFVLGCDGAHSITRSSLIQKRRFNFNQEYISHDYKNLRIPPTKDGEFAMPPNYIHVWPRGTAMMVGLPNVDKSFNLILYLTEHWLNVIKNEDDLLATFMKLFPDVVPLIGKEQLAKDFFSKGSYGIVSVKCSPYHWKDKVVLMGDAAHAMVSFMGQGMNCGMEDVTYLARLLEQHHGNRMAAFAEYSTIRVPDAQAVTKQSIINYHDLHNLVATSPYSLRFNLDMAMRQLVPYQTWTPLFNRIHFSNERNTECVKKNIRQEKILTGLTTTVGVFGVAAITFLGFKIYKKIN